MTGTCSGVPAGSPVIVSCGATKGTGTMISPAPDLTSIDVSVSGGTLAAVPPAAGPAASVNVAWTTPAAGPATVTCTAHAGAYTNLTPAILNVELSAAATPPVISSFTRPTGPVLLGAAVPLSVAATDPLGGTLTYAWSADGGSFDVTNAASVNWTAPDAGGNFNVTVAVSNATGTTSRVETFEVAVSVYQGNVSTRMRAPRRVAATGTGEMAVADGDGRLLLLTQRGELRGAPTVDAPILSVAGGDGAVFAATRTGVILTIDVASGRVLRRLRLGTASGPVAMAWDRVRGLLWVVEAGSPGARALRSNGTVALEVRATPTIPALNGTTDVAVDAAGRVWIAQALNTTSSMVHAFDGASGAFIRSMVPMGTGAGQVQRVGGVGTDAAGRVYVTDVFGGNIKVLQADGTALGTLGSFGDGPGQLRQPAGLAAMSNGDMLVANLDVGRLDRFGSGVPLPICTVGGKLDSDCDGMPDEWELAHGLNPFDPSDAMIDSDGDGLTNGEEFAYGTDPWKTDTDGDGMSDWAEIQAGSDPLNAFDQGAMMMASGPGETRPGEVKLSATVSGSGACAPAWKQVGGAAVVLRGPATLTPSFIARAAGVYTFEGQVTCGGKQSPASTVAVTVLNVAPRAAADKVAVVSAGDRLELSAAASSDANGDVLRFAWEADASAVGTKAGLALRTANLGLGYHAFRATVLDPEGAADAVDVPVMVVDERLAAPTAIVDQSLLTGEVGQPVQLSAVASIGQAWRWEQVAGPAAVLSDPAAAAPTFTPGVAGRYTFTAQAIDGLAWSAPATVEVFVHDGGSALPMAAPASPGATLPVNTAVVLDGSASAAASGGTLGYGWKQVAGPAAAIVDEDRAQATAVAFVPGWYEFELTVEESGAVSVPARIGFEARAANAPIPQARATAQSTALTGELVRLDGRASAGARHFHWTQVAGPWVAVKAAQPAPTFVPVAEGLYRFELEVDDGAVRSRPVSVQVNVNGKGN